MNQCGSNADDVLDNGDIAEVQTSGICRRKWKRKLPAEGKTDANANQFKIQKYISFQDATLPTTDTTPPSSSLQFEQFEEDDGKPEIVSSASLGLFRFLGKEASFFQDTCKVEDESPEYRKYAVPLKVVINPESKVSYKGLEELNAYRRLESDAGKDPTLHSRVLQMNRQSVNGTLQIIGKVLRATAKELEQGPTKGKVLAIDPNMLLQSTLLKRLPKSMQKSYYGPPIPVVQEVLCPNIPLVAGDSFWKELETGNADGDIWLTLPSDSLSYQDGRSLRPNAQITNFVVGILSTEIYKNSNSTRLSGLTPALTESYFLGNTKPSYQDAVDDFKKENLNPAIIAFPMIQDSRFFVIAFTVLTKELVIYDPRELEGTRVPAAIVKIINKIKEFLNLGYGAFPDEKKEFQFKYNQPARLLLQEDDDTTNGGIFCLLFLEYVGKTSFWKKLVLVNTLPAAEQTEPDQKAGFFQQDYVPPPKALNPATDKRFKRNKQVDSTLLQPLSINLEDMRKHYFRKLKSLGTRVK